MKLILAVKLENSATAFLYEMDKKQADFPILGRLGGLVVSVVHGVGIFSAALLAVIESVALAGINLIGAAFSDKYSLSEAGEAINLMGWSMAGLLGFPVITLVDIVYGVIMNTHLLIENPRETSTTL